MLCNTWRECWKIDKLQFPEFMWSVNSCEVSIHVKCQPMWMAHRQKNATTFTEVFPGSVVRHGVWWTFRDYCNDSPLSTYVVLSTLQRMLPWFIGGDTYVCCPVVSIDMHTGPAVVNTILQSHRPSFNNLFHNTLIYNKHDCFILPPHELW